MDVQVNNRVQTRPKMSGVTLVIGGLLLISVAANAYLAWSRVQLKRSAEVAKLESQLQVGYGVPAISARSLNGQPAVIGFKSELPTVLYFFSPGCDTCARNVDNIKKLADGKRGEFNVVGLSLSDEGLEQYVRAHSLNFPVYGGLGVETALAYKLGRVPQTTVVSPEGRILANWYGPYDGKLRPAIEEHFHLVF